MRRKGKPDKNETNLVNNLLSVFHNDTRKLEMLIYHDVLLFNLKKKIKAYVL